MQLPEAIFWILASWLLAAAFLHHAAGPLLYDDSYQYLSVAKNIASGEGIETSIVHFDVERRHGVLPAPVTTFPPGYPILLAAGHALQLRYDVAAVIIGFISLAGLVWCYIRIATDLGISLWCLRLILLLLTLNSLVLWASISVLSEAAFVGLSTAALTFLIRAEAEADGSKSQVWSLIIGLILAGLAFYFRYAGIFLIAAICIFNAIRVFLYPGRRSIIRVLLCAIPVFLAASLFLRNYLYAGILSGGNDKISDNSLPSVIRATVFSIQHVFYGRPAAATNLIANIGALIGLLALALLLIVTFVERSRFGQISLTRSVRLRAVGLLVLYIAVYLVGIVDIAHHANISNGPRLYYPLLSPILITLALLLDPLARSAATMNAWRKGFATLGLIGLLASYFVANVSAALVPVAASAHRLVESRLAEPGKGGQPLSAWIQAHVPADAVIAATDGQATGYALQRSTISLVSSQYSSARWDEATLRDEMRKFGAEFLILYPHDEDGDTTVQQESPFIAELVSGKAPPWLTLVAENPSVEIYRIKPAT